MTAGLLAGCPSERPKEPQLSEVMPDLPLPPLASVVSREGGADALAITFRSSLQPDSMAAYYRNVLTGGVWTLVSDTRDAGGVISMYAERNGPSLWVRIRIDSGSTGSLVTLAGAKAASDSAAAKRDSTQRHDSTAVK